MRLYRERIQGFALALIGLVFGSMALVYGHWQADDTEVERKLCRQVGVCASQTLRQAARNLIWSAAPDGLEQAIAIDEELLAGDPAEPENWAGLGEALAMAGRDAEAAKAYDTALRLGPNRPDILMRTTNWAFETDRIDLATELARRTLSLVRNYDQVLYRFLRLTGLSPEETMARAIPEQREPMASYFQTVIRTEGSGAAQAVWRRMAELNLIEPEDAPQYVAKLLEDGFPREAIEAQRSVAGDREPGWPESNLVFNGGFEHEPLGTALDWRIRPHNRVEIAMDREVKAEGEQSLRIRFQGGENVQFANVSQTVVLQPGRQYRMTAQVRSEEVTTDEGLRFEVRAARGRQRFTAETAPIRGDSAWTEVELLFRAPATLDAAELVLVRRRSSRIASKVEGTVWVDGVELSAAN